MLYMNWQKYVSAAKATSSFPELPFAKNGPDAIREKVLELIQCWSHGLGKLPNSSAVSRSASIFVLEGQQHKIFTDTYNLMKLESYRFPPLKESEVMFENSDIAPEWRDDKECFRCRQTFTTFVRKVTSVSSVY